MRRDEFAERLSHDGLADGMSEPAEHRAHFESAAPVSPSVYLTVATLRSR